MPSPRSISLLLDTALFRPGLRLAVGVSGGADSVALLRALHQRSAELGLVLHVAHLHHGLRGAEADADLAFCRELAAQLGLPFHEARVGTQAEARENSETIEEAARRLRYEWFRSLLAKGPLDAVATAHTLDDQAETVLAKFLRGAWTEGLSGIHPTLECPVGTIVRPLLSTTRAEVESFLRALGQPWREDSSNRNLTFTRNRIRHELLPLLETWNPRLREHMAQMAALARAEETWWQAELERLAPQLLLTGRPVRGGGRASGPHDSQVLAIDVTRFAALAPALQRRLLRFAALKLGAAPDFAATETLLSIALAGRAGEKRELAQGLHAERTHRELRLSAAPIFAGEENPSPGQEGNVNAECTFVIPGEVVSAVFGLRIRIDLTAPADSASRTATLRNWKAGDRVRPRYSSGFKKVKEVLERIHVTGSARRLWPVLEVGGEILWLRGIELEPRPGVAITAAGLDGTLAPGGTEESNSPNLTHP